MPPNFLSPSLYTPFLITLLTLDRSARRLYDEALDLDALATDAAKEPDRRHFFDIEGIAEEEMHGEEDQPEYAKLGDLALGHYVKAAEHASQLDAAAVIMVVNDALQDLATRLELPTELRLDFGVRVGDTSFTKALCAAGNNFRHWREWAEFEREHEAKIRQIDEIIGVHDGIEQIDPDVSLDAEQDGISKGILKERLLQLRSIRVLRSALEIEDTMGRIVSVDLLKKLEDQGIDTFDAVQAAALDAAEQMVAARGARAVKGFHTAREWQGRYAEALREDVR